MDEQSGGKNAVPSWVQNFQNQPKPVTSSDNTQNKKPSLSDAVRQKQAATNLARQRVLEAYQAQSRNFVPPASETAAQQGPSGLYKSAVGEATGGVGQVKVQNVGPSYEQGGVPQVNSEDWRKYHSAWQDYYQKYYGQYYSRAAQEYVAREKMRMERNHAEEMRKMQTSGTMPTPAQVIEAGSIQDSASREIQDDFREKIRKRAEERANKMRKSRHFVPIIVGLIVLLLGVLLQYNQVICANVMAYMSPGDNSSNTITAVDPTVVAATHSDPTLMIPKLNVEVPIRMHNKNDVNSMNIAMSNGVAQFTLNGANADPGQIGNFVVSGHSAGNIYQQSDYKFIFSGLTRMAPGDLVYVDYNSQRYSYRITGTKTVNPSDVQALVQIARDNADKPMITLITCTPLGTSKYRLLVYGEQIYPDPSSAATQDPGSEPSEDENAGTAMMPANEASPLEQFWKWLTGQE